jgi:hypothetical protein
MLARLLGEVMQKSDAAIAEDRSRGSQPSFEHVERLAGELQKFCAGQGIAPASKGLSAMLLPGDIEQIALDLEALRLGAPPSDLNHEIQRLLLSLQREWASQTTLIRFREEVERLTEPLQKSTGEISEYEEEVALRRERLETLRLLVNLLDELVCMQPRSAGADAADSLDPNTSSGGQHEL